MPSKGPPPMSKAISQKGAVTATRTNNPILVCRVILLLRHYGCVEGEKTAGWPSCSESRVVRYKPDRAAWFAVPKNRLKPESNPGDTHMRKHITSIPQKRAKEATDEPARHSRNPIGILPPPLWGRSEVGGLGCPPSCPSPTRGEGNPQFHRSATATSRKSCRNCFTLHDCSTDEQSGFHPFDIDLSVRRRPGGRLACDRGIQRRW